MIEILNASLTNFDLTKVRSLRLNHGITAQKRTDIPSSSYPLLGVERFIATQDFEYDIYTKAGDIWWKVTIVVQGVSYIGWVAEIHLGARQLNAVLETPAPDPEPNPDPIFPETFTLKDADGVQAEYVFVRIIE